LRECYGPKDSEADGIKKREQTIMALRVSMPESRRLSVGGIITGPTPTTPALLCTLWQVVSHIHNDIALLIANTMRSAGII
jgi:hypothetical protein